MNNANGKTGFGTKVGEAMRRTAAIAGAGVAGVSGAVAPMSNHNPVLNTPVPAIHQRMQNIGNAGKGADQVLGAITDARSNALQSKANGPSSVTAALTRGSTQNKSSGGASAALKGISSGTSKGSSASSGGKSGGSSSGGQRR
jgi:hypothetical protein